MAASRSSSTPPSTPHSQRAPAVSISAVASPEAHAPALSRNTALTASVRDAIASGMPTVAECAGLLYLCRTLEGHDFVGAVPADAAMHPRLTLRYRSARTTVDSILGPAGTTSRGHEFHRTRTEPGVGPTAAWAHEDGVEGFALDPAGIGHATVHASICTPTGPGTRPCLAAFAASRARVCRAAAGPPRRTSSSSPNGSCTGRVPVRTEPAASVGGPPRRRRGRARTGRLRRQRPSARTAGLARDRPARRHRRPRGIPGRRRGRSGTGPTPWRPRGDGPAHERGAEAFTLIARAIAGPATLVVHPQFTEPESALRRAGRVPDQHVLSAPDGFVLHPERVPADADLVFVGNPTNPTGVLHPRSSLESLRAPDVSWWSTRPSWMPLSGA